MADITMPKMGFDMTEGTIVRWLKQSGDVVKRGEEIAEIETDKVTIAIEAFDSGTISAIIVQEGQTAPVGAPIAHLTTDGESASSSREQAAHPAAPGETSAANAAAEQSIETSTDTQYAPSITASPLARRMAREAGIDLRQINGSGPNGRIVREDIETFRTHPALPPRTHAPGATQPNQPARPPALSVVGAPPPVVTTPPPVVAAPPPSIVHQPAVQAPHDSSTLVPLTGMRRTITRRMVQSWQQAPHFFVTIDVDMGTALDLRKQINASRPKEDQISLNDLIVKACAMALRDFPNLNASYSDAGIEHHAHINISIAVALDTGLIAPVIANCHERSLGAIARESRRLIGLAREGQLGAEQVQGGTFTISNLGMYGVSDFIAIITPPQSAVLAIGGVQRVPVFKDDSDEVVAKHSMKITISADHRVSDGAEAARFIGAVKHLLESPLHLLID